MSEKLIVASGSLGRRELLKFHGYDFEVKPSNVPERVTTTADNRHGRGEVAGTAAGHRVAA